MQIPLQITFRHMEPSLAIENKIKAHVQKLEKNYNRITSCRVVVEAPHQHHHKGKLFHVEVDLTIPGEEIVANRNPHLNHAHEDLYVAIRDSFTAVRRKLNKEVKRRKGIKKTHGPSRVGKVIALQPQKQRGQIATLDGRELYFHKDSVLNGDFAHLAIGTKVRFAEEEGGNGPEVSVLRMIRSRKNNDKDEALNGG